ncbi:hypothetical protein MH109_13740 [Bacillus altitudinis]|uniref:hypothetical protein n=1 Tax=Bacillus altitudinis TaxID=293387 RepID=UPI002282F0F6|nr:hypothetical protein [Bacillus altitudinis]MCY7695426.1 hypothetical protein [Bacillus altitudinis]
MKSFISKRTTIKKSEIFNRYCSLHPKEHRIIDIKNTNKRQIRDLVIDEDVGEQIDVSEYLNFDTGYYLGTISCMTGVLFNPKKGKKISPDIYNLSSKKLKKGDFVISRNASLGKIAYINRDVKAILNGGISVLRFHEEYKWYAPAFFMVDYGREYLTCITSGGGTQQNAKRSNLLDVEIPIPSISNHSEPKKIVKIISLIVQNIIDKEEQIQNKNSQINKLIDDELNNNQGEKKYIFSYPKVSNIKNFEKRLDTSLYTKKYQESVYKVKNYTKGSFEISGLFNKSSKKFISGLTPEAYMSVNQFNKDNYWWIAVADISYGLCFNKIIELKLNNDICNHLLEDGDILITRKGATVGKLIMFYKDYLEKAFVNEDIKVLRLPIENYKKVFIAMFLNSHYGQKQLLSNGSKGTKQGLTNDNILNTIVPNFPEDKQYNISNIYFKKIDKNTNLDFNNYLELEKLRNKSLGIYQLNIEVIKLRNTLSDLLDFIINKKQIIVDFSKYV